MQEAVLSHSGAGETPVRDFFSLLKPRVMTLVVFTGYVGYSVAPGELHPFLAFVAILCLALGAGASGAFNMWYDRDMDAVMSRTRKRALPSGRIEPADALAFSIVLSILSVMIMGLALNWTSAAVLAFASVFYGGVYTVWLKRRTDQNIVIGGLAGALPPLVGWTAVTGSISLEPLVLVLVIFLWTPPHFWALSLVSNEDYRKAGVPMLSVTAGRKVTARHMLAYTILLLPVSLLPAFMGVAGWKFGLVALLLGGFFIYAAFDVLKHTSERSAKRMFGYSVFYLFSYFLALVSDAHY